MTPIQARKPTIRLLILQPTPFCNIACDYCYLAHRTETHRMSLDVVEAALRNVRDSGLLDEELSVIWHAGEPLIAPPWFYRESFQLAEQTLPRDLRLTHCIQTNGLLINDAWCDLFAEWDVRVGVSLDGPDFLHDQHRKTRNGRPTHSRVMAGIARLQSRKIPFHVIAVVTRDSLEHAEAIMHFFVSHGITQIGFNIDEAEGIHPDSSMKGMEEGYQRFMQHVIAAVRGAPIEVSVREITTAMQMIKKGIPETRLGDKTLPWNPQVLPGAIVSVDHAGRFTSWSPELLDVKHEKYGDFVLGNVRTDSISVVLTSDKAQAIQNDITEGIEACRGSCEFFAYCGGGAPVNKLAENGSFISKDTVYCHCTIQVPIKAVLDALEQELGLTTVHRAGRAPGNAVLRGMLR